MGAADCTLIGQPAASVQMLQLGTLGYFNTFTVKGGSLRHNL